jgi:hypothetical protein
MVLGLCTTGYVMPPWIAMPTPQSEGDSRRENLWFGELRVSPLRRYAAPVEMTVSG